MIGVGLQIFIENSTAIISQEGLLELDQRRLLLRLKLDYYALV